MKKVMILVASLMVVISSFAGYTSDMINRMETKEKSVEDSFGGSNAEMKEASSVILDGWNDELNKVYKLLMSKLSSTQKTKLRNEEREWLKRRERKVNSETEGGTGMGFRLVYYSIMTEWTRDRAIELARRYDNLK